MQSIEIAVSVKALNPKAFIVKDAAGETLFSYGAPVIHIAANGEKYIDAIAWGRSKSTSLHMKEFTGEDKEALTKRVLAGEYELVRLVAPNVSWTAPVKSVKAPAPENAEQ